MTGNQPGHVTGKFRLGWYLLFCTLCLPVCLEVALRLLGYSPYQPVPYSVQSEPSGCLIPHQRYGFALQPGHFRVGINERVWYQVNHGPDSFRVTAYGRPDTGKQVWLLGCSFAYGMGEEDTTTSAWKIQQGRPDLWIRNMGVPGHGTVHAMLRLQDQLVKGDTPAVAVVMFSAFHMERNVLSPGFRSSLVTGYGNAAPGMDIAMQQASIPFIAADSLRFETWNRLYSPWPGREYSAAVTFLQGINDRFNASHLDARAVTLRLFGKISDFCRNHSISLLVAGISTDNATNAVLAQLQRSGVTVVRTGVDISDPKMTHAPDDSHPNAKAHRIYADSILSALNHLLP